MENLFREAWVLDETEGEWWVEKNKTAAQLTLRLAFSQVQHLGKVLPRTDEGPTRRRWKIQTTRPPDFPQP